MTVMDWIVFAAVMFSVGTVIGWVADSVWEWLKKKVWWL